MCWLSPVLRSEDAIVRSPQFSTPQAKAIPDPAVYADWFRRVEDQRRIKAVGARRYREMVNIQGGRASVEWESFVDPDTGDLMSVSRLQSETTQQRQERIARVKERVAQNRQNIAQVSRFGFVPEVPPESPRPVPAPKPKPKPAKKATAKKKPKPSRAVDAFGFSIEEPAESVTVQPEPTPAPATDTQAIADYIVARVAGIDSYLKPSLPTGALYQELLARWPKLSIEDYHAIIVNLGKAKKVGFQVFTQAHSQLPAVEIEAAIAIEDTPGKLSAVRLRAPADAPFTGDLSKGSGFSTIARGLKSAGIQGQPQPI